MKNLLLMSTFALFFLIALCGCRATPEIAAEDYYMPQMCSEEIAVLKSSLPANSKEKYDAAVAIAEKIDFQTLRNTRTTDKIFNNADARIAKVNEYENYLIYIFSYQEKSIRFVFYLNKIDIVTNVEVTLKNDK